MSEETTEKARILHMAEAAFTAQVPGMALYSSGQGTETIDKFQFPDDYYEIIKICSHYYRTDPIVSNTINKILDLGFKQYSLQRRECTDEEFLVYSSIDNKVLWHLRDLALEYSVSGLVLPEVVWATVDGSEINPDLSGTYDVPDVLWKRDPHSLELLKTPIPNRVVVTVVPSAEDIAFIKDNGVYPDGTKDKETFQLLKKEYPKYVRAIKAGKVKFKLDDPHLIRRNPLPDTPYPTPYLLPILEILEHKRNLRKMDYAIAARVITAIMLVRIGNDEYPLTEDDDDIVLEIRKQFQYRGLASNIERLFQLFTNHTVDISWITPDVTALLDDKKYEAVNLDILFGLGLPRIMLTGETAKSATSQGEFALLSPAETIKSIRNALLSWPERLYREMRERNNFVNLPSPAFSEVRLYDIAKLMQVADLVYERGGLSKTTLARLAGFDFEFEELPQRVKEKEWFDSLDLDEYPAMPFDKGPDDVGEGNETSNAS